MLFAFFQFQTETETVNDLILMMELEMLAESAVQLVRKQNQDYLKTGRVEFHWQEPLKVKILHEDFLNLQLDCVAC